MKKLFFVLALLFAALPADAQQAGCVNATPCVQTNTFVPSGSASLAVSSASSRVALPTAGSNLTAVVTNSGAAISYIVLGGSSVTATASNIPVQPGQTVALLQAANTYVAGITASGTSSLLIQSGTGVPVVSTISGTVNTSATFSGAIPAGSNLIGSVNALPKASASVTTAGCTVGVASAQCLAAATAVSTLTIQNTSAATSLACKWGGTAILNDSGSFMLAPGQARQWGVSTAGLPNNALNCIAPVAATPLYVEYN